MISPGLNIETTIYESLGEHRAQITIRLDKKSRRIIMDPSDAKSISSRLHNAALAAARALESAKEKVSA
jgi:hypothetical protein